MVTGYQYLEDGTFVGVYKFPRNGDVADYIHMPPLTTLLPPPAMPAGKIAKWTGTAWSLINAPLPQWLVDFDFPSPDRLEIPYIARMKNAGVYGLFVKAYFDKGLVPSADPAAFDLLVGAGADSRAADRIKALATMFPRTLPVADAPVVATPAIYPPPQPT